MAEEPVTLGGGGSSAEVVAEVTFPVPPEGAIGRVIFPAPPAEAIFPRPISQAGTSRALRAPRDPAAGVSHQGVATSFSRHAPVRERSDATALVGHLPVVQPLDKVLGPHNNLPLEQSHPGGTPKTGRNKPSQLPAKGSGNFLGAAAGVGAGAALGAHLGIVRVSSRPIDEVRARTATRPEQRPNWSQRSQNRDDQWRDRVNNRSEAWNKRTEQRQDRRDDFQNNRDERWDKLQSARDDRQEWRDQRREDWQQHREDLWDYRADRAEEIWDNAQDFYDDVFDDAWWGHAGWGGYWPGYYPLDPWWWWGTATWNTMVTYTSVSPEPVYIDYGMNVIYEGDTVYVDNKPCQPSNTTDRF